MNKYFKVEQHPDPTNVRFHIRMTDEFYNVVGPLHGQQFVSYAFIFHRLFGLQPHEFYQYITIQYGATIHPAWKGSSFLNFFFVDQKKASIFCEAVNRKFEFCVVRGIFDIYDDDKME